MWKIFTSLITALYDMSSCSSVRGYQRFWSKFSLHLQIIRKKICGQKISSETLVFVCKDIGRHMQVDTYLITDHPRILTSRNLVLTQDD